MCPSHVTKKWVREIGETLPDTYAMVVRNITDLNRLYAMYEQGDKSVYAVFSKERARDGYMRGPAVRWNRRRRAFLCPDCDAVIEMDISEDGISYTVPADQFFFRKENMVNHVCAHCGTPLWSAVNPSKRTEWVKIGEYGWVHRYGAAAHLKRTKNGTYHMTVRELARTMILDVLRTTGITATAGIGTNLYLCKVAMNIMAKHVAPDESGVRIAELDEMSYRRQLWMHRPLTDFWRAGKGYAKKLEAIGIYTMGDIARCSIGKVGEYYNEALLYKLFGINAELLIDHAWGWESCRISDIKVYRPETNCVSSGQVLQSP